MERERSGLTEATRLLDTLCLEKQGMSAVSDRVTLYPGFDLWLRAEGVKHPIEGRYGLMQFLENSHVTPVARMGFSFQEQSLVITNSPQGFSREYLLNYHTPEQVSEVMRELKTNAFRDDLMHSLIALGRVCAPVGIESIKGISAEHHNKVDRNGGPLAYDHALKSMNYLYERHGFMQDSGGDYYLSLK